MKRWIASVLAAAMLLPCVPTAGAVDAQSKEPPATGTSAYRPESLKDSGPEVVQSEEEISPDEEVTAIIVLEKKISPLARFQQKSIQNEISKNVLDGEKLEVLHSYTTVENGFAAVVPYGKLEEIRQLPGVATAYAAPVFKVAPDMPTTMTELGGLENTSGYQGEGMVIAIVDSGLEISHPLFTQAPTTPALTQTDIENVLARKNLKAEEKKPGITASQVYKTAKVPFAFDYADNDLDVAPNGAGDHGTHVAGIAAANAGVVADVVGVAPQAQILAMKVFSSSGSNGATWADILAAADDAVALGADVINMSLGSTCGFSTPEGEEGVAEVLKNIASSGVMLSISAGNEYSAALGTRIGKGHALTQNPDYGTVASPSSYSEPLSIASVEKADSIDSCYLTVGERKVAFNDTVEDKTVENVKDDSPSFRSLAGKELEYVVVPNAGEAKDYDGLSVEGKIALVSRGSVEYNTKKEAAKAAGAAGILVYNNEPGMLYMQMDNYDLPSAFISQADGKALAAVAEGNRKLTVSASYGKVDNPTSGEMSDFSSWGVTPELTLKPDLTAPGGNIKSATTGGGYTTKSGTSMSAPFVSGAMALVKQYVEQKNYAFTETNKANLVSNLLMSTADLVMAGTAPYSPRKQGAGSVNIAAATSTKAYLTAVGGGRPKVELGDDAQKTGKYEVKFEVHNLTNEELTYTVGGYIQTDAQEVTKQIEGEDVHQVTELPYKLSTQIAAQKITVPASGTVTVTVPVSLNQPDRDYMDSFANGTYIEGFVTLTPESDTQPTLSIPYMGFYGDWTQAPIIDATDYGDVLNDKENNWSQAYVNTAASNSLEGTVNTYLGDNPYHSGESYLAARNAISPNRDDYMDTLSFVYTGLLRNVKALNYEIKDAETGDVYYSNKVDYETKSVYSSNYYQIVPSGASDYNKLSWGGTKKDGYSKLKNNDKVIVTVSGELSYDKHVANNQKSSWSFPITIDTEEPEAKDITVSNENGKYYVSLKVTDNQFVSNVTISNNAESKELAGFPVAETTAGATTECKYDITGFGENLKVVVNDYACNRKVYSIKAEGNTDASEVIVPTRTVLTEDFEETTFPPEGWSVKSTVKDKTWYQGTEYGSKMAMVDLSKTEQQNEWLISPAIDLSEQETKAGIVFDFYTNYYWSVTNHHHNLKVMASTNGTDWEQIWQLWDWNTKNEFGPWEKTQAKVTIPDKFQNAESVKFAFVYEGKDSTSLWLDNVQVYVEDPSQIHTITATAGEGGKIDPSGTVQINDGKSKTFTITPDAGRFISDVKVDGTSVGTPTTYTFSKVMENHTIEVTFGGSADTEQLIDEDFESGTMPTGWKTEQTNTTAYNGSWKIYKYFKHYGLYCSADEYDAEYNQGMVGQNERVILPAQKLNGKTANIVFEFSANPDRLKSGKTVCTLEGSTDGGQTWTTIWNAGDVVDQLKKGTVADFPSAIGTANISLPVPAEMQKDDVLFSFHYVLPKYSTVGTLVFIDNLKLQADQSSSGGGESTLLDEDFNDCSAGSNLPEGWTRKYKATNTFNTWRISKLGETLAGSCSADTDSVNDWGDEYGAGQDEYLITPALNLDGQNATMAFQFSAQKNKLSKIVTINKTTATLEVSLDGGKTWSELWNAADVKDQLVSGVASSYAETADFTVSIPDEYQKDGVQFAFRYQTKSGNTGGCTVYVDNVKLTTSGGGTTPVEPTTYTITASAGQGGSISPNGSVSVAKGADQKFTITPSEGYEIADVQVDGQSVGKKTEYTFENVTKAHTIAATFMEKAVALPDSIHEDFNNSEALPDGWTVDGPSSKYYNTWKIDRYTALNSSNAAICTQNIMFKQEQNEKLILPQIKMKSSMALTFDFGGSYEELSSGSIKFTVKATKDKGQTWTEIWNAKEYLPTVDEDSSVEDITGKGNVAIPSTFCVDGAQFAFVFESSDRRNGSVAVDNVVLDTSSTPAPERYGITIATMQNGTVTADKTTAAAGETVTLTVNPDAGYHLKSLMAGDETLTSAPYTFTMPAKEVTVSALFEKDAEQPTTGSYKDGTYTGSATGHGGKVSVTVTVKNGNISNIEVTEQQETPKYWEKAKATISALLGLGDDASVDAVDTKTGATLSSEAIRQAVKNALKNAEEADGSESNPYVIANIDQLKAFADAVNKGNSYAGKYVVLGANLDLAEIAIWAPIGNSDHGKTNAFAGTFDGKGYTVSHVNCGKAGAAASYEAIGFFGVVSGTVKNLNVQIDKFYNTYSESNIAMGGLVGILESKAVIDHCSVTGPDFALSDEGNAAKVVGGLVGHMKSNSLVANSWSDIYISAGSLALNTQISVGGICGQQAQNSLIANSASFGSVVSTVMTGKLRVGGLVGQTSGAIYNCYTSSTTKATLMGTDFKADDAAATTAIGHLIGCSTTGAALYDCYYDKNADQFSNSDMAGDPEEGKTERRQATGWENGSNVKTDESFIKAKTASELTSAAFAAVLNGNLKNTIKSAATAYFQSKNLLTGSADVAGMEDKLDSGFRSWALTGDRVLFGDTAVVTVDVASVALLEQRSVAYGTAKNALKLPETVEVTLSNNKKVNLSVHWTCDKYDGNTAGDYTFEGTLLLTDGITNPKSLKAYVVVKVQPKQDGGNTGGGGSGGGGGGSSGGGSSSGGSGNTGNNGSSSTPFLDIRTHWAKSAIESAVAKGLFAGTTPTTFHPDQAMNRAMLVTVLYRMEKEPAAEGRGKSFEDVSAGAYYAKAVVWASDKGIVAGYSETQFGPEDTITREQLAVILNRYATYKGYNTSKTADLAAFQDADQISEWARVPVQWANVMKLLNGRTSTTLAPKGSATRAEVAKILVTFLDTVKR